MELKFIGQGLDPESDITTGNFIIDSLDVNSYERGSSSHLVKVGDPHQDDSFAEQLKTSSSVHLTLDIFEPIYRSGGPALRRPGAPAARRSGGPAALQPVHCSIRR